MGSSAIFSKQILLSFTNLPGTRSYLWEIGRTPRQSWGDGISPLLLLIVDHTNSIFLPAVLYAIFLYISLVMTLSFVIRTPDIRRQFSFVLTVWERKQKG